MAPDDHLPAEEIDFVPKTLMMRHSPAKLHALEDIRKRGEVDPRDRDIEYLDKKGR